MNKLTLIGATVAVLGLGLVSAHAMGGGNLSPDASPYAIIEPQVQAPLASHEGRAAYTNDQPGAWSNGYAQPGYAAPVAAPEDRTYYSRGR